MGAKQVLSGLDAVTAQSGNSKNQFTKKVVQGWGLGRRVSLEGRREQHNVVAKGRSLLQTRLQSELAWAGLHYGRSNLAVLLWVAEGLRWKFCVSPAPATAVTCIY